MDKAVQAEGCSRQSLPRPPRAPRVPPLPRPSLSQQSSQSSESGSGPRPRKQRFFPKVEEPTPLSLGFGLIRLELRVSPELVYFALWAGFSGADPVGFRAGEEGAGFGLDLYNLTRNHQGLRHGGRIRPLLLPPLASR